MRVTTTIGQHEYNIQLATPEYMVSREAEGTNENIKQRLEELSGTVFFLIRIGETEKSRKGKGGNRNAELQLNADKMITYYGQQAALDLSLYQAGEERKPTTYHFEPNYDLAPYNTIIAGFEALPGNGDLKLVFNDRFNNHPNINVVFSRKNMENLPQLQY